MDKTEEDIRYIGGVMGKWREYGSYEAWKDSNHSELKAEHDEYIDKEYDWVMPYKFVSFDDFCMGKWQRII